MDIWSYSCNIFRYTIYFSKYIKNITETEFLNKVENNEVKSVTFVTNAGYAEVELNNSINSSKLRFRYSDIRDVKEQIRLKNSENYQIIIDSREENRMFGEILSWILPLIIFIGIWIFIMRRMGAVAEEAVVDKFLT